MRTILWKMVGLAERAYACSDVVRMTQHRWCMADATVTDRFFGRFEVQRSIRGADGPFAAEPDATVVVLPSASGR